MGYLRADGRGRVVAALTGAFVLSLALVVCARDPLGLLAGWELMTILSGALILVARGGDRLARRTVFAYLALTHLGGAGTWVAVLLLAKAGALGGHAAIASGSGLQVAVALAALVGMGTKAGVMPLHVWLPRAHPLAPAPVSALMSGVMIKVALYVLVRVLVEWDGILPVWLGVLVLGLGALSSVGGVVYALFQHDLKRLLALHSIENVGIIVLGLGAALVFRARGEEAWAAVALAAALLHTLNHAVFKALLFLGAGAFERAVGALRVDRLGGLLRRMPWTGAAFLVGAAAIAGLPPLNGFASEWLTLQALAARALRRARRRRGRRGDRARGARGDGGARGLLLRQGGRARAPRAAADGGGRRRGRGAALARASRCSSSRAVCVVLGAAPGLLFGRLVGLAPWRAAAPAHAGLVVPGTGSLPTLGILVALVAGTALLAVLRGRRARRARADLGVRAARRARARLDERRVHEAAAARARGGAAAGARDPRPQRGRRRPGDRLPRSRAASDRRARLPPGDPRLALRCRPDARRLQSGSLAAYVAYLVALVIVLLAAARLGVIG